VLISVLRKNLLLVWDYWITNSSYILLPKKQSEGVRFCYFGTHSKYSATLSKIHSYRLLFGDFAHWSKIHSYRLLFGDFAHWDIN